MKRFAAWPIISAVALMTACAAHKPPSAPQIKQTYAAFSRNGGDDLHALASGPTIVPGFVISANSDTCVYHPDSRLFHCPVTVADEEVVRKRDTHRVILMMSDDSGQWRIEATMHQ